MLRLVAERDQIAKRYGIDRSNFKIMTMDFKANVLALQPYANQQILAAVFITVKLEKAEPPGGFERRAQVKLQDHAKLEHFVQFGVDLACKNGGHIVDLHWRSKIRMRNLKSRHI